MPRQVVGPRLYFDTVRASWVIREGSKFVRTGTADRARADLELAYYCATQSGKTPVVRDVIGRVYFVSTDAVPGFPIKIGFTATAGDFRLRGLQNGCPYPLQVLAAFSGRYRDENSLHRQFAASRLSGEWFQRTPELLAIIEAIQMENAA